MNAGIILETLLCFKDTYDKLSVCGYAGDNVNNRIAYQAIDIGQRFLSDKIKDLINGEEAIKYDNGLTVSCDLNGALNLTFPYQEPITVYDGTATTSGLVRIGNVIKTISLNSLHGHLQFIIDGKANMTPDLVVNDEVKPIDCLLLMCEVIRLTAASESFKVVQLNDFNQEYQKELSEKWDRLIEKTKEIQRNYSSDNLYAPVVIEVDDKVSFQIHGRHDSYFEATRDDSGFYVNTDEQEFANGVIEYARNIALNSREVISRHTLLTDLDALYILTVDLGNTNREFIDYLDLVETKRFNKLATDAAFSRLLSLTKHIFDASGITTITDNGNIGLNLNHEDISKGFEGIREAYDGAKLLKWTSRGAHVVDIVLVRLNDIVIGFSRDGKGDVKIHLQHQEVHDRLRRLKYKNLSLITALCTSTSASQSKARVADLSWLLTPNPRQPLSSKEHCDDFDLFGEE